MPSLNIRKPKIDPNQIYVALIDFVGEDFVVGHGDRLRGSHPRVKATPHLFALDGTPSDEMAQMRAALAGEYVGPAPDPTIRLPKPIPLERQVRATSTVYNHRYVVFWEGQILDRDDPIVKEFKKNFAPVAGPG